MSIAWSILFRNRVNLRIQTQLKTRMVKFKWARICRWTNRTANLSLSRCPSCARWSLRLIVSCTSSSTWLISFSWPKRMHRDSSSNGRQTPDYLWTQQACHRVRPLCANASDSPSLRSRWSRKTPMILWCMCRDSSSRWLGQFSKLARLRLSFRKIARAIVSWWRWGRSMLWGALRRMTCWAALSKRQRRRCQLCSLITCSWSQWTSKRTKKVNHVQRCSSWRKWSFGWLITTFSWISIRSLLLLLGLRDSGLESS